MDPYSKLTGNTPTTQPGGINTPPPVPPGVSSQDKYKKTKQRLWIVSGVAVVLLIATGFLVFRATVTTGQLDNSYNKGFAAGKDDQSNSDQAKIKDITENPYRSYTGPDAYGNFVLYFPRNWSFVVTTLQPDFTSLASPDYVNSSSDKQAFRFTIRTGKYGDAKSKYDALVRNSKKQLVSKEITVSGINGTSYTGVLDTKITNGTVVILPLRDKVVTFQTDDNSAYSQYFTEMLNKVKINP